MDNLANQIAQTYKQNTTDAVKELAKENGLNSKVAQKVVQDNANVIAREIETVKKQAQIDQNAAKIQYENNDRSQK